MIQHIHFSARAWLNPLTLIPHLGSLISCMESKFKHAIEGLRMITVKQDPNLNLIAERRLKSKRNLNPKEEKKRRKEINVTNHLNLRKAQRTKLNWFMNLDHMRITRCEPAKGLKVLILHFLIPTDGIRRNAVRSITSFHISLQSKIKPRQF